MLPDRLNDRRAFTVSAPHGIRTAPLLLLVACLLAGTAGCPGISITTGNPFDNDGDGFTDVEERTAIPGSDPCNPADTPLNPIDSDGDGCSDFDERNFDNFCDNDPDSPVLPDPGPDARNTFELRVARHADEPITADQVDAILAQASAVLQSLDVPCPDTAADVTFQRSQALESFADAAAIITTEAQLDAVFALPQDIKIVSMMVGVCGIASSEDMSVILGCASRGTSLVVSATAAPDVWAHEWGHVQGLGHRDDCSRNVMHTFELDTNAINPFERRAFLAPRLVEPKARLARQDEVAPLTIVGLKPAEQVELSLARLLDKPTLVGIPARYLHHLTPDDSAMLHALLAGSGSASRRKNTIRALGFTRDGQACRALKDQILAAEGPHDFDQMAALAEAFLALGRLAAFDTDGFATTFLIDASDPNFWAGADKRSSFSNHHDAAMHALLARLAIMGLRVSGDARAHAGLRELHQRLQNGAPELLPVADQILDAQALTHQGVLRAAEPARSVRQP